MNKTIEKYPMPGWKKNTACNLKNDEGLLLRGSLADVFIIGAEISEYVNEYYYFKIPGDTEESLGIKYGKATQMGFELFIIYKYNTLDISSLLDYNENDEIVTNKVQISLSKMGNYDEELLFVTAGDGCLQLTTYIYKYGELGFKEIAKISGQKYMFLDYDLMVPYGSQGLFDSYVYCKNNIYAVTDI